MRTKEHFKENSHRCCSSTSRDDEESYSPLSEGRCERIQFRLPLIRRGPGGGRKSQGTNPLESPLTNGRCEKIQFQFPSLVRRGPGGGRKSQGTNPLESLTKRDTREAAAKSILSHLQGAASLGRPGMSTHARQDCCRNVASSSPGALGRILNTVLFLMSSLLTINSPVFSEDTSPEKDQRESDRNVLIERGHVRMTGPEQGGPLPFVQWIAAGPASEAPVGFGFPGIAFGEKSVKGAPYSAEAVTETTQTLVDGNRIHRKMAATVYRDNEGRTRREHTLNFPEGESSAESLQQILINDPVAGVHYLLDPATRTAHKLPFPRFGQKDGRTFGTHIQVAVKRPQNSEDVLVATAPAVPLGVRTRQAVQQSSEDIKTEPLGKQTLEGIEVEGTRSTITIPASKIGNELPIQIVSEQWYAPELQTVLVSKHNDPRSGETVYRLTDIVRGDPPRSLFEVPSDYTLKDEPPMIRFRKKLKDPNDGR